MRMRLLESDQGPSLRLKVVSGYFMVSGAMAVGGILLGTVLTLGTTGMRDVLIVVSVVLSAVGLALLASVWPEIRDGRVSTARP